MATIDGLTVQSDDEMTGAIIALVVDPEGSFRPIAEEARDKAPDWRLSCDGADLGAAWTKASQDNNDDLSARLDAPSFGAALNAALGVLDGVHALG